MINVKHIIKYLRITVVVLLIVSILVYFYKNLDELAEILHGIDIIEYGYVIVFMLLSYLTASFGLFVVLRLKSPKLKWKSLLRFYMEKKLLNMHFPQLGSVHEAVSLKYKFDVSYMDYAASFIVITWMSACFNLFMTLLFIGYTTVIGGNMVDSSVVIVIGLLLFMMMVAPFVLGSVFRQFNGRVGKNASWGIVNKADSLASIVRNDLLKLEVMPLLLLVLLLQFFIVVCYMYFGLSSIGMTREFYDIVPFVVLSIFLGLVNIIPGNIGINEYAYGIVGGFYDMKMSEGIVLSLIFRVASYLSLLSMIAPVYTYNLIRRFDK